jgi:hypothetical protein
MKWMEIWLPSRKKGDLTIVSQHGKYRDVDFPAIAFLRSVKYCERLKTKSGKMIPTVVARFATDEESAEQQVQVKTEDIAVLELLAEDARLSLRDIAGKLLWMLKSGDFDAKKVQRVIKRLRKAELIDETNEVTGLGEKRLHDYRQSKPAASKGNGASSMPAVLFAQ